MKKKFSIRSQLILYLVVFVLLILGLISIFQTVFLQGFYKESKIHTLSGVASRIENALIEDDFDSYMESVTISNEVCVRVVSNNSVYNNVGPCALRNLDNNMINDIANQVEINDGDKLFTNYVYQNFRDMESTDIYLYAKMIDVNNDKVMILVSTMITPINTTISVIKSQYWLIVIIIIVLTIVLAFIMSRFIIFPIKQINNESSKLAKGEYDASKMKLFTSEFNDLNNNLAKANEDILKADKAKKELLSNVSHDLRTPLTMIVGYGEMIKDLPEENNDENINVIIDEAKRLSTLVDDILDLSRIENNDIVLNRSEIKVSDLINSVYKQYYMYCKSQKVKLKVDIKEDGLINVDVNRIKQVLYNFVNNSLNYNDNPSQEIIIGSMKVDNKIRIYVHDNGQGISEDDIDKIWDRYYKVDKLHKRQHIGSGIGLSLCKQLLEKHELNYGVDSKIGEYSMFYFDV